jgi:hypothetical protein
MEALATDYVISRMCQFVAVTGGSSAAATGGEMTDPATMSHPALGKGAGGFGRVLPGSPAVS